MTLFEVFSRVLNMSLTASLVILAVLLARVALKKCPKVFSYILWAAVLFRLLCPVSLPSPVSLMGALDAPAEQSQGITTTVRYVRHEQLLEREAPPVYEPTAFAPKEHPLPSAEDYIPSHTEPTLPNWTDIVAALWLTGAASVMLYGIGTYLLFRKKLQTSVRLRGNVYLADHMDTAFVAGLFFPKIYLPSHLSEAQLPYIIAHERHHIRRFDHVVKHLAFLALAIHWFNPLVWAAFLLAGRDMEMSCDEAVIKRLGPQIRADYSASLLSLATKGRIIAATPLAFGEGDTKGRVLNMAKWKKPRWWVSVICSVLCIAILTACAANPDRDAVISKNDGAFDASLIQTATVPNVPQHVEVTEEFTSTDGSVEFTMQLDQTIIPPEVPVVEVVPHYFTGEDAKRISHVLFGGDAVFYEKEPTLAPYEELYTREDALAALQRWSSYANLDALRELQGKHTSPSDVEVVKAGIEKLTAALDHIPEGKTYRNAEWIMRPDDEYFYTAEQLAEMDEDDRDNLQSVQVMTNVDGIQYQLDFTIRDDEQYKLSSFYMTPNTVMSPLYLDADIFRAQLLRTGEPTQEQIDAAVKKAGELLNSLDLGQWQVDSCEVWVPDLRGVEEYTIIVKALPVFNGVAAIRQPAVDSIKSDDIYAQNCYMTEAKIEYNAEGKLVGFEMQTPMDVVEVLNDNVATMTMDDLIQRVKDQLSLTDKEAFGMTGQFLDIMERGAGEEFICMVDLCQIEYGMVRIRIPNTEDGYYYVPALKCSGTIDYVGAQSGEVYSSSGTEILGERILPILVLNAVDGSVIEQGIG